jgi:regulatory protein
MTDRDALQHALNLLARRPLTEFELRRALESDGRSPAEIDTACRHLHRDGYLDDRELAQDFIRTRSQRLGHGPGRLLEDLRRRGIPRNTSEAALAMVVASGDVDPVEVLRSQIRRRTGGASSLDRRAFARVYNALLRAGFNEDMVRQELERYLDERIPPDASFADEADDDFR